MTRHVCHTCYVLILNDKLKLLVFWQLIISSSPELEININSSNNYIIVAKMFCFRSIKNYLAIRNMSSMLFCI